MRWTYQTRRWVYRFLCERDGEKCLVCDKTPHRNRSLEIDHVDNNPHNENPSNLCLLCHKCNNDLRRITTKQKVKLIKLKWLHCVCVCDRQAQSSTTGIAKYLVDYGEGSSEMKANDLFEVQFREWLLQLLHIYRWLTKKEVIASGAEKTGCSPMTIQRYLSKLTSIEGILQEEKNDQRQTIIKFKKEIADQAISLKAMIASAEKSLYRVRKVSHEN